MSDFAVIFVFLLSYAVRMYTMKVMTKKQKEGVIYFKWSYPVLLCSYLTVYFGSLAEHFVGIKEYGLPVNIAGVVLLFTGLLITGSAIKSVGSSWSQHIEIKKNHKL